MEIGVAAANLAPTRAGPWNRRPRRRRGPTADDVLANDEHIVALLHATADREGKRLDQNYVIVFQMRDGKVHAAWEVWKDQPSVMNSGRELAARRFWTTVRCARKSFAR